MLGPVAIWTQCLAGLAGAAVMRVRGVFGWAARLTVRAAGGSDASARAGSCGSAFTRAAMSARPFDGAAAAGSLAAGGIALADVGAEFAIPVGSITVKFGSPVVAPGISTSLTVAAEGWGAVMDGSVNGCWDGGVAMSETGGMLVSTGGAGWITAAAGGWGRVTAGGGGWTAGLG